VSRFLRTLRMIRFEHSVFALPFALAGAFLAAGGPPPALDLLGIVLAAVAARSAAMGFNRWVDRDIDAANPRTADRELVRGTLTAGYALGFTLVSSAIFVAVSWWLAPICGMFALPVLVVLFGYSRLKRHTWLCHLGLGAALGLSPAGAWLAVAKEFAPGWPLPLWIGLGVMCWTAGFDLLYSIQDEDHDRGVGLHSLPARFGARSARWVSAVMYAICLAVWLQVGCEAGMGGAYWIGLGGVAALFLSQHWLVRGGRVDRIPLAFFRVNAWVSVVYFAGFWAGLPGR
jgi:4-hydroxybenzoate polyprenyltransferase